MTLECFKLSLNRLLLLPESFYGHFSNSMYKVWPNFLEALERVSSNQKTRIFDTQEINEGFNAKDPELQTDTQKIKEGDIKAYFPVY